MGRENGSSLTNTETTVTAGRDARFSSGQDLILDGAQASGKSVTADFGRNLWVSSRQDSDQYDMKQTRSSRASSRGAAGLTLRWAISEDVAQITSARMFTAGSDGGLLYGPRSPKYGKTAL